MEILDAPESFEIKVPIRKYWIPMFVFGGATLGLILIFLMMFYKGFLDGEPYFPDEAIILLICFLVFLNLGMWFNYGFEKLVFTSNRLDIIKSNQIFSIKKTINICEIEVVEISDNEDHFSLFDGVIRIVGMKERGMFFWRRMGQLTLRSKNRKRTILNGLEENEIVKMKKIIEREIEQRCS